MTGEAEAQAQTQATPHYGSGKLIALLSVAVIVLSMIAALLAVRLYQRDERMAMMRDLDERKMIGKSVLKELPVPIPVLPPENESDTDRHERIRKALMKEVMSSGRDEIEFNKLIFMNYYAALLRTCPLILDVAVEQSVEIRQSAPTPFHLAEGEGDHPGAFDIDIKWGEGSWRNMPLFLFDTDTLNEEGRPYTTFTVTAGPERGIVVTSPSARWLCGEPLSDDGPGKGHDGKDHGKGAASSPHSVFIPFRDFPPRSPMGIAHLPFGIVR